MTARILVVAGNDPSSGAGGGAGVDADREAARHFGVEAECVVTAWTDQGAGRVRSIGARAAGEWSREARAALDLAIPARPFGALKSGLLPDAASVSALAALARDFVRAGRAVVVDPVLAASGGEAFLDEEGIEALLAELLPTGVILTPNLVEAARLTGRTLEELAEGPPEERTARVEAARTLIARGARAVLVKDGHGAGPTATDLLLEGDRPPVWIAHPRHPGASLHGSGCRHASALAAQLAAGASLEAAARGAAAYLNDLLAALRPT